MTCDKIFLLIFKTKLILSCFHLRLGPCSPPGFGSGLGVGFGLGSGFGPVSGPAILYKINNNNGIWFHITSSSSFQAKIDFRYLILKFILLLKF